MDLIKKIASCGLALSMSLSGVYANSPQPHSPNIPKNSNTSLNTPQKIIAGVSTAEGVGLLAGIGIGTWCYSTRKLPVLIIGEDENIRQELIQAIRNNAGKADKIPGLAEKFETKLECGGNILWGMEKRKACVSNWNIRQCGLDDPQFTDLAKKSTVIITILDSQNTADRLHKMLEYVPNHYDRTVMSVMTFNKYPGTALSKNTVHGTSDQILDCDYVLSWDRANGSFKCTRNSTPPTTLLTEKKVREINKKANKEWNEWIRNHPKPKA